MNTKEPIESKLNRLAETVTLRTDEKDLHRDNLRAFMAKGRAPVHSPFSWLVQPSMRYMGTFMLFLVVSGTGAVSAAEAARPGDVLYGVKLHITEPARSAFIFDKKEKTEFEVERIDRRLKEFSLVAASENPDSETTALIKESLAENIAVITEDVEELTALGDSEEALSVNTDLKSVLSAHSLVLQEITERNPESADDVETIRVSVDSGIASSENAEQGIEDAIDSSSADEASVEEQETETDISLTGVFSQLLEEAASIDTNDRAEIEESLGEVQATIAEARAARDAGDRKEAYLLYIEAKERLDGLQTLVEADRDLGIGVLDADGNEDSVRE